MESTSKAPPAQWVALDTSPEHAYPVERFGADWNGWHTPVVTATTLVTLLLNVISEPSSSYLAFAIDTAGGCTLQDNEGRTDTLSPGADGLYDLGELGWTFGPAPHA